MDRTKMTDFIVIGEAPGPRSDLETHSPLFPIPKTGSGRKLMDIMGLSRADYLKMTKINLVPIPECKLKKSDFREVARWSAKGMMRGGLFRGKSVLLLGRRVQEAFNMNHDPLEWIGPLNSPRAPFFRIAYVPHPSGMNRFWNDEENKKKARQFFSEAFNSV